MRALVGPRIRERRRALKLSQTALAKAVGISPSYLNLIEHNRRGIAGRTLNALARELDLRTADLSDDADTELIGQLAEAAGAAPDASAETDRVTEFLARFPGWAKALAAHHATTERQSRHLEMLSDRLSHDPYLSEAMHLMLSSVTAVSATSGILIEGGAMTEAQRERFTGNLHAESQRLTDTARDLVAYFDKPATEADSGEDPAEAFWAAHGHHLPKLEADPDAAKQID
ncbi:MAG: helix-turn-helix domain-containing protein, partial [Pseudomonadota bacterium]